MKKKKIPPFVAPQVLAPDCPVETGGFDHIGPDAEKRESIARPSISYWQDALRRLKENRTALLCIIILAVIIAFAVVVPAVSPYTISEQHLTHTNAKMFFQAEDGHMHLFGTDDLGRDVFTRIWGGGRTSLFIAITAVLVNLLIGVIYGSVAGYMGGWVDNILMRIIEIINGIPYMMIVILLLLVLEPGVGAMIIAYALVGWTGMARLVRGQIMSLKEQEFVVAAKALGAPASRIISRHLVPNLLSVVIVNLTLAIPNAIFTEAFLSYIGLGVPIPNASWGTLAQDGVRVFQMYPTQLFLPALFISLTMLSFNLLGDGMRDAFDPRLRR